jgi:hypothetical protein
LSDRSKIKTNAIDEEIRGKRLKKKGQGKEKRKERRK